MLKDMIAQDTQDLFFNIGEFAQSAIINSTEMAIIVDNDRLISRSKKEFDGISIGEMLIFVKKTDINQLEEGQYLVIDGVQMRVFNVREDYGMYEIILTRNGGY